MIFFMYLRDLKYTCGNDEYIFKTLSFSLKSKKIVGPSVVISKRIVRFEANAKVSIKF